MGDEGEGKQDCVKVAVRLRPLSSKELGNNEESIIALEEQPSGDSSAGNGKVIIEDPDGKEKPGEFAFDIVFGTKTEQDTVFQAVGGAAVRQTLKGYNGTIFAYGQTGSGKSWCMMGGPGDLKGIIPRVNENLFVKIDELQQEKSTRNFLVMCSFFEIYNEIIFDLLNPVQDRSKVGAGLQVKEHPVLGIYVKDLQEVVATDAVKLEKLMNDGTKNRAVSSTMMNAVSSRSHSIFTVKVHQKDDEDKSKNVFAKLNLVDLAGSERQKGTGASGQTLKEGANINKSLSALGNVINALVEIANGKKVFVPFRNSKLTRVLQESLGGNSLCTMLATLSPAACNYEETMSTLRYANRAKAIKVSASKNEEASQISRLNAEIEELKKKLEAGGGGGGGGGGPVAEEERKAIQEKFQAQLEDMQKMVSSTWEEKSKVTEEFERKLSAARDEQKRQTKAMQEECRKRLRLLEEQNNLDLSIRALMDNLQSLPQRPEGSETSSPSAQLRSCELPREWQKEVKALLELMEDVKKEYTMILVFQGAFREDLRLWVDGEESPDHAMARTGARRALTKLDALKRETLKLSDLEGNFRSKGLALVEMIRDGRREWLDSGLQITTEELKNSDDPQAEPLSPDSDGAAVAAGGLADLSPLYAQTLEDIGRILFLIEQQAKSKAEDESEGLTGLEAQPLAELLLRGSELVPGSLAPQSSEEQTLRYFLNPREVSEGAEAEKADPASVVPRTERPIHEWTPEDADDTVEGTEFALTQVASLESLAKKKTPQELLARPPPKFVHDVALVVQQATGFLQAMPSEWPEAPREARIDLLQYISDSVASTLALSSIKFDPVDVLKGKEVPQTLRLLQLLAIAAARFMHQSSGNGADNSNSRKKDDGTIGPGEMLSLLDTASRCLQAVMELQAARSDMDGAASPARELESNCRSLLDRIETETQLRKRNEERLEELQREVESEQGVLSEQTEQLEVLKQAAAQASSRKEEVRRQLEDFRAELLERAAKLEATNPEVARKRNEVWQRSEDVARCHEKKTILLTEVNSLEQKQIESNSERETLEMEAHRIKADMAQGLNAGAVQSEEILYLQAEKQKLDMKITDLDEKLREISEEDDNVRQMELELSEAKKQLESKAEDLQLQLQVIIEERDGLREGIDLLWQEKTRQEEELENVSEGYTNLSDRYFEKIEEARELEEELQKYDGLIEMLHASREKMRASPPLQVVDVVAAPPAPPPGPPPEDDDNSSHYSDDFEPEQ